MQDFEQSPVSRRTVLKIALYGGAAAALASTAPLLFAQSAVPMDVYKDPSCGCCNGWIDHMTANDFASTVHHPSNLNALKAEQGIAPQLQSCHTAITEDGYVFEGHVPAKFVKQFLASPPAGGRGLSVPGMPMGTPGMDFGNDFTPYDVILLKEDGSSAVYASVKQAQDQF